VWTQPQGLSVDHAPPAGSGRSTSRPETPTDTETASEGGCWASSPISAPTGVPQGAGAGVLRDG